MVANSELMTQAEIYTLCRKLALENKEWCVHWIDQDILDLLRKHDRIERDNLSMRYIDQCHHPEIKIEALENNDFKCEFVCTDCGLLGKNYSYPKTAQAIKEYLLELTKDELPELDE